MAHIFKAFEFLSYFTCMGACIFRMALANQNILALIAINDRLAKILWISFSILFISTMISFFFRIQAMSGASFVDVFAYIIPAFQKTHYGSIFILRLIFLVCLGICLVMHTKHKNIKIDVIMFMLIMGIGYTFSAVSHAADKGSFSIAEAIDWIHVISTAIWGGSILITLLVFYQNIPHELLEKKINIAVYISKLSTVCAYALLFVLITGFYKIQSMPSNGMPLWHTDYGQLLGFKLIFVILLVSFGAMNRYVSLPNAARWANRSTNAFYNPIQFFTCVLVAQTCILFIILAITSNLIDHSPV